MTRTTAMRVRMDLALKMNPADIADVMATAEKITELKQAATDMGFIFTADVSAKVGTVASDSAVIPGVETE